MAWSQCNYYDTIHYKHHMEPFYFFPLKYYMSCNKWKFPDLYSVMVFDLKTFFLSVEDTFPVLQSLSV